MTGQKKELAKNVLFVNGNLSALLPVQLTHSAESADTIDYTVTVTELVSSLNFNDSDCYSADVDRYSLFFCTDCLCLLDLTFNMYQNMPEIN